MTQVSSIGEKIGADEPDMPVLAGSLVEVLVCVTCRGILSTTDTDARDRRQGAVLLDLLADRPLPENVAIRSVECLSNCTKGCTVALRGDRRWTYIYGNIDPVTHLDALIEGITRYSISSDGLVPWRERPDHFRKNCIARIPPLEATNV